MAGSDTATSVDCHCSTNTQVNFTMTDCEAAGDYYTPKRLPLPSQRLLPTGLTTASKARVQPISRMIDVRQALVIHVCRVHDFLHATAGGCSGLQLVQTLIGSRLRCLKSYRLGAVKAVPEICSAYRPNGQTCRIELELFCQPRNGLARFRRCYAVYLVLVVKQYMHATSIQLARIMID